jgi:hypothetical protein
MKTKAMDLEMISRPSHWCLAMGSGEGGGSIIIPGVWRGEVKRGVM